MAMYCVLPYMLEAVKGELCLLQVLKSLKVPDMTRWILLCMLEVVEGVLYLLDEQAKWIGGARA